MRVEQKAEKNKMSAKKKSSKRKVTSKSLIAKRYWTIAAENIETTPDALMWLAKTKDDRVLRRIAANPKTPENVLVKLALASDSHLQHDAIFNEGLTSTGFDLLFEHSKTHWILAKSPLIPETMLEQLARSKDPRVRAGVAKNILSNEKILNGLAKDDDEWVRVAVAANSSATSKQLTSLLKDSDENVLCALAENPSSPPKVLETLSKGGEWKIKGGISTKYAGQSIEENLRLRNLASNPSLSVELFKTLADCPDEVARIFLAKNSACPSKVLKKLSGDSDGAVQAAVAEHPATPLDVLVYLAEKYSKREEVVCSILKNPRCPKELFHRFCDSRSVDVRSAIAQAPACPPEILEQYTEDKNKSVRRYALVHPELPIKVKASVIDKAEIDDEVLLLISRNMGQEEAMARKLLASGKKRARQIVAFHCRLPEVLKLLLTDDDPDVLGYLLRNPACDVDLKKTIRDIYLPTADYS